MKYFVFLLILSCFFLTNINAEHPKFEECKKASAMHFKKSHKYAMECHANLKDDKLSIQEQFEKIGCTVRCLLKLDKMVDENELATEQVLKSNYKGRVIPEFEDKLLSQFMECKTKFGEKLDKTDPNCKSYKEYGLCMQEAISHVCYENP